MNEAIKGELHLRVRLLIWARARRLELEFRLELELELELEPADRRRGTNQAASGPAEWDAPPTGFCEGRRPARRQTSCKMWHTFRQVEPDPDLEPAADWNSESQLGVALVSASGRNSAGQRELPRRPAPRTRRRRRPCWRRRQSQGERAAGGPRRHLALARRRPPNVGQAQPAARLGRCSRRRC